MKKMNMVAKFEGVIDLLNGKSVEGFSKEDAEVFLRERIAQTVKKNASGGGKPTKTQVENEGIKAEIVEVLGRATAPMTVKAVMEAVDIDSNQKITSLLTQLVKADVVVRTETKGKAYYALATKD